MVPSPFQMGEILRIKAGTYTFPGRDLVCSVYTRDIVVPTGLRGDERCLCYKQSSRSACALIIILQGKIAMDVLVVGLKPSQRGHDDTMSKGRPPNLNWFEKNIVHWHR